ncbi:anaerobic ribonucleoside-triphosphate reductase activating protein [Johnsonella ignava ATCC 51276]|jgi:anaerobic ribonucleoside-triphosphate reductase activating protein|uniref:Anaerobic ribonucleoside-triphosphate reductase-activating protein n=1 Tax=Johnsonella ignava ATCC 51276 TaxID=679200 RepID=G5GIY1_9FIRM|nr:anaerobic ribonucleoside-triphosphate reductase activating protein [Johnsonella ignava ATCC 51276]
MKYANIKYYDIANGAGIRTSLFVSGCTHRCKGCFNEAAWDFNFGSEFTDSVIEAILESITPDYIKGLSLLGGEPMEPANQPAVLELLRKFKKRFPKKDIWCYSGFTYDIDFLEGGKAYTDISDEILSLIDVMVDGKFEMELYDVSLRFRGSSNQRLIDVPKSRSAKQIVLWDE